MSFEVHDRIESFRGGPVQHGTVFKFKGELWVRWDDGAGFVTVRQLQRDCALQNLPNNPKKIGRAGFVIEVEICGMKRHVAMQPTWDASWHTDKPERVKVFCLKRNAEKWLSERPEINGRVVPTP